MVRILTIFFFVYSICGFSQRTVGSKPDKYSKIIFEYEQKLNVYIDDSGIYADTLVFKELFKEYPIVLKRHPKDTRKMVSFLPKRNVQKDKIDKIIGIFSHNNFLIKGEYNVKNQRVVFSFSRSENDSVQKKLKTIFLRTYPNSSGRDKIIDYRKNIISRELTLLTFESPFDVSKNSVDWIDKENLVAMYKTEIRDRVYNDLIFFDKNLDKYISPIPSFSNSEFGIIKIESVINTAELVSVKYK